VWVRGVPENTRFSKMGYKTMIKEDMNYVLFRVTDEVIHNLLKPIMSLGTPLSERVKEPR